MKKIKMGDFKGIMLILLNLSNLVVQLAATSSVNLIVLSSRKRKVHAIQALNASRKQLKRHLKMDFKEDIWSFTQQTC
jgi:hypothetical protein